MLKQTRPRMTHSASAPPVEPIRALRQQTIRKLSERAIGRLTYQVGVGASGTVYLAIKGNDGGGYFSPEWVSLPRIRACLAGYLDTQALVTAPILRAAYVNRSVNNGGFLAAVLRHEELLKAGDQPHQHRCSGDWEAWEAAQRQSLQEAEAVVSQGLEGGAEGKSRPAPKSRKGKMLATPVQDSSHEER